MEASASPSEFTGRKRRAQPSLAELLQPLNDEVLQTAVTEIVQHLLEKPAKIMYARVKVFSDEMLPKRNEQPAKPANKAETPFSEQYLTLMSIPKEWIKEYLQEIEPTIFTEDVVNQVEKADKGKKTSSTLRDLFNMGHAVKGTTKWPKIAKDRNVFRRVMLKIYKDHGRRLQGITVSRNDKNLWQIDWKASCVYRLLPQDAAEKTQVRHIEGAVADLPTPVGDYEVEEWWSEMGALLKFNRMSTSFSDIFPNDVAAQFKTHRAFESLNAVVCEILGEIAAEADDEQGAGESHAAPPTGQPARR